MHSKMNSSTNSTGETNVPQTTEKVDNGIEVMFA